MPYILKEFEELQAETILAPNKKGNLVKKPGTYLLNILHEMHITGAERKAITFRNRVPIVAQFPNCFRESK